MSQPREAGQTELEEVSQVEIPRTLCYIMSFSPGGVKHFCVVLIIF